MVAGAVAAEGEHDDSPACDPVDDLDVGLRDIFPEHVFEFDELAHHAGVEVESELVAV